jgi:hypothetical protein
MLKAVFNPNNMWQKKVLQTNDLEYFFGGKRYKIALVGMTWQTDCWNKHASF